MFAAIPGNPLAYWISRNAIRIFESAQTVGEIAETRNGFTTGNNDLFLRFWFEVSDSNIFYNATDRIQAMYSGQKWFPYNKGGSYRKWYGNHDYVINWHNNGVDLVKFGHLVPRSINYMFFPSISWSKISSGRISFRYFPKGFMFDVAGLSLFIGDEDVENTNFILGLLNSCITKYYLSIFSPTLNFEVGQIANIPVSIKDRALVQTIVETNMDLAQFDWNAFETSWDFKKHPLI